MQSIAAEYVKSCTSPEFIVMTFLALLYLSWEKIYPAVLPLVLSPYKSYRQVNMLLGELHGHPDNDRARQKLVTILLEQGQYVSAIDYMLRFDGEFQEKAEFHYYLGSAHLQLRKLVRAEQELLKAVKINSKLFNGKIYIGLAECSYLQGRSDIALQYLAKALEWFPSAQTLFEVGELYRKYGEKAKAKSAYKLLTGAFPYQLSYRKSSDWPWVLRARWKALWL